MQFIYLHVKHAVRNIQRVQRIFGQGLITTDVPTETFWNEKKVKQESFNAYFAEVNHNGEDDLEVSLIDQTDNVEELKKKESFGNMSCILSSRMDWMDVAWRSSFWCLNLSFLF